MSSRQRHVQPRPDLRLRLFGGASALLAAALPLLESLHSSSVAHVTCAEHGELIDLERTDASRPGNSPHQHEANGVLLAERDPPRPGASGALHDHCAIVLHARQRLRAEAAVSLQGRPTLRALPEPLAPAPPPLRLQPVYRLAPKSSPPVA